MGLCRESCPSISKQKIEQEADIFRSENPAHFPVLIQHQNPLVAELHPLQTPYIRDKHQGQLAHVSKRKFFRQIVVFQFWPNEVLGRNKAVSGVSGLKSNRPRPRLEAKEGILQRCWL